MRVALFYFCEHNLSKPSPGEQEGEWGGVESDSDYKSEY